MDVYEILSLLFLRGTFLIALLVYARHGWYILMLMHHDFTRLDSLCEFILIMHLAAPYFIYR